MNDFELTKRCALFDFGCSNAAAKAVLVTLAAKTNSTGRVTGQKVDDLARACCVQRNAFLKAVAWLEEKGLLTVKRHKALASVYIFNEEAILRDRLVGIESVTENESIESDTNCENLGYASDTKLVMDTTPTKLRIHNQVGIESVTTYKKEKNKKEKIYQEGLSISSCFKTFGQNPVAAPTRWEPDEENVYDLPVKQQVAMSRKIDVDVNDLSRVLSASEIVVLAATLGYRLTHNVALDDIADRKTVTVAMVKEAVQRTKDNVGGVGYLIRILQNASKDPDAFNGVRKVPDVTPENITDKQCYAFAKKLVSYHPFASKNAKYMEEESEMVERITGRLKDKDFFEQCRPTLVKLGCLKGATA